MSFPTLFRKYLIFKYQDEVNYVQRHSAISFTIYLIIIDESMFSFILKCDYEAN